MLLRRCCSCSMAGAALVLLALLPVLLHAATQAPPSASWMPDLNQDQVLLWKTVDKGITALNDLSTLSINSLQLGRYAFFLSPTKKTDFPLPRGIEAIDLQYNNRVPYDIEHSSDRHPCFDVVGNALVFSSTLGAPARHGWNINIAHSLPWSQARSAACRVLSSLLGVSHSSVEPQCWPSIDRMLARAAITNQFDGLMGSFDLARWEAGDDDSLGASGAAASNAEHSQRVAHLWLPLDSFTHTNISFFLGALQGPSATHSKLQQLLDHRRRAWNIDPSANYYTVSLRLRLRRDSLVFTESATLLALSSNPVIFETENLRSTSFMRLLSNAPATPFSRRSISNACVTANLSTVDATIRDSQWKTEPYHIPDELYYWANCNAQHLVVHMDRQLLNTGFHRVLRTRAIIHRNERYKNADAAFASSTCRAILVEHLDNSIFVDKYEVQEAHRFGAPKVLMQRTIDLEKTSLDATQNIIVVVANVTQLSEDELQVDASLQLHFRYQPATRGSLFVPVEIQLPEIYLDCGPITRRPNAVLHPDLTFNSIQWPLLFPLAQLPTIHGQSALEHIDDRWCLAQRQYHVRSNQAPPSGSDEIVRTSGVLVAKIPVGNSDHLAKLAMYSVAVPALTLFFILSAIYDAKFAKPANARAASAAAAAATAAVAVSSTATGLSKTQRASNVRDKPKSHSSAPYQHCYFLDDDDDDEQGATSDRERDHDLPVPRHLPGIQHHHRHQHHHHHDYDDDTTNDAEL